MPHLNIEIKARTSRQDEIRKILKSQDANFRGTDHQIDTYFRVSNGRLKLRKGNIENHLIHYDRPNESGPKRAEVTLFRTEPESELRGLLERALGVLIVVDKRREIYFIDNVKYHIDTVAGLGSFVEIEAIDMTGETAAEKLREQCEHGMKLLRIEPQDLIARSYSDLLLKKQSA